MHSFSVNIRISKPSKEMFTSASPRWTSLFSGWQILVLTSKECINCIMTRECHKHTMTEAKLLHPTEYSKNHGLFKSVIFWSLVIKNFQDSPLYSFSLRFSFLTVTYLLFALPVLKSFLLISCFTVWLTVQNRLNNFILI